MKRLRDSGKPLVLTFNAKAEVVAQDAAAYQRVLELAERAEVLRLPSETREDADACRTVPVREFLQSLG